MTLQKLPELAASDAPEEGELRVPCEVWSRIVGYMRPVSAWNQGKQQEFVDRVVYQPETPVKKD